MAGLGDILSMALQQTGVDPLTAPNLPTAEDPPSVLQPVNGALDNSVLSTDIGSLTAGLFSNYPTPNPSQTIKQEHDDLSSSFPVSTNFIPSTGDTPAVVKTEDTLSTACATYLDPAPTNVKTEPHENLSYSTPGSLNTSIKSENMNGESFTEPSTFGSISIDDLNFIDGSIDFNDILGSADSGNTNFSLDTKQYSSCTETHPHPTNTSEHTPTPTFGSTDQSFFSQPENNSSLPQLMDDDLSRLLEATGSDFFDSIVPSDNTPSVNSVPEYDFPPRQPTNHYTTYGGVHVQGLPSAVNQLVTTSGSINFPSNSGEVMVRGGLTHRQPQAVPPLGHRGGINNRHNKTLGAQRFINRRMAPTGPGIRRQQLPTGQPDNPGVSGLPQGEEDSDEEEEAYVTADTYTNYTPTKLKLGCVHPDPIVESSSLSSVEPPQVWFDLKLPANVIDECKLSSLQLESIVYACQQHMNILADGTRAGFLVGDGAGVGKGRTIAGMIYQNYLEGRKKAVWLSVSNDLKFDAIRDLRDVGAKKIDVYSLNKFHYGKISGKRNGRVRKGVIFATYASLIGESSSGGKYRTRFNQLLHWLGPHYEGIIVFDECHKAKNLVPSGASKPSKTGLTVLELQKKLPKARIVYCSATGASEPRNMAYMSRLGIWGMGTQFQNFQDFIKAVEGRGVGAMEMVAMDMKLRGMYMARQLSFSGVKFSVDEVELSPSFVEAYDASVELWIDARRLFQEAADLMDYEKKKNKTMWGQFWGAHQRFFKYMCIAAKVPETIRQAKKAIEEGKCIVIGLQSTGEARTMEQLEKEDGELTGFISTVRGVLDTVIRRHFPTPISTSIGDIDWSIFNDDPTLPRSCRKRKRVTTRRRGPLFQEDDAGSSDSETSDSLGGSDSAVESSSDDGEESSAESGSSTSASEGESETEERDNFNPFGSDISEPWLKKKDKGKSKKQKLGPSAKKKKKQKNFSIKAPPTSSRKGSKTKTGFNSKSLKFEPVNSPMDFPVKKPPTSTPPQRTPPPLTQKQHSIPGNGQSPLNSLEVKGHKNMSLGEHTNIVDAMSSKFSLDAVGESRAVRDAAVRKMKAELLRKLDLLSPHLPTNTLDELIDGLGGPRHVAEMTGRRGRVVGLPDGSVQYQLRSEGDVSIEMLNITEKQRFMDGLKNIAIISEAASSGISLQADRRAKNQKCRVHITLELPWSADRAIQQFGRTHRSNQVSAPEYIFLISRLSGEQRFASIVAKRLESLGALTHGDRRATESRDLSKYNVDTKYGRQALETTVKSIVGTGPKLVTTEEYSEQFFDKCRQAMVGVGLLNKDPHSAVSADKDSMVMSRFLNRILGLPVTLQNNLFSYFSDTLGAIIKKAKRLGKWDLGIMDFGASGENVEIVETLEFVGDAAFGTATTQLHKVRVERGMSFKEAVEKLNTDHFPGEGFYVSKRVCNDKQVAVLIKSTDSTGKYFQIYRPNTGRQSRTEKLPKILKKNDKVDLEEAEKWWNLQYESARTTCNHAFWQGKCRMLIMKQGCEVGLRQRTYHVLSGSILGVWSHVEGVFMRHASHAQRMQIVRVRTQQKRLVGILVPSSCVEDMRLTLHRIAQQAEADSCGTADNPIEL